jgi:hypothetical protein
LLVIAAASAKPIVSTVGFAIYRTPGIAGEMFSFFPLIRVRRVKVTESAGLNRHIVGDERALQKRRSDSILASSLALLLARVIAEA